MGENISWDLYRSFLSVLREGSLSGAARALGSTQPTVGRHLAALEAALGQVLFIRVPAGLLPTEAALALQLHAAEMESAAAAFTRAAQSQGAGVQGCVRITASEVIAVEVLPRILVPLRERYPDLSIELVPSNQVQDLLRREADVAVRMVRPTQQQLLAQRVGIVEIGLHASKSYIEWHGMPASFEELAAHALIGFDVEQPFMRKFDKNLGGLQREHFTLRTDSDLAQLALIRAGAGVGGCQVPLGREDAGLVRLLPTAFAIPLETWVTMHEDLRHSPRCRVTFDALVEGLRQYIGQS